MTPQSVTQPLAQLTCDLCHWPMPIPDHCVKAGAILGLLVCSLCTEDALQARQFEETHASH